MTRTATTTVQINRIYIKATPQAIWDAITSPEWTARYGYRGRVDYDLRPGGRCRKIADEAMHPAGLPGSGVVGEVTEADPPNRLVQTWRACLDRRSADPADLRHFGERANGVTCLTITHELQGAPGTAAMVAGTVEGAGGGWGQRCSATSRRCWRPGRRCPRWACRDDSPGGFVRPCRNDVAAARRIAADRTFG